MKHVVVVKRTGENVPMQSGRDVWWHEQMEKASAECAPEAVDAEHPLFILYTSGTTGKPKGVVHTTGGYLVQVALTTRYVFDIKDEDVYWCTADIGWVTGHSYVVYGPLCIGATSFMYEGAPNHPGPDRFWIMGRVDDVINVAGHRLGTMDIESALVSHPKVAEAAVVGRPDELKGSALVCFVTPRSGNTADETLRTELKAHVVKEIAALARPDDIRFTEALPKTRSGKIMRRLLRDIAAGKETVGDTTTLEDHSVLAKLREEEE